jgi:hypothetical protein
VGWLWLVLLACAVAVLVAAEWPRLATRLGREERDGRPRRARRRRRRKAPHLRALPDESDDFARSVERDLARLPTTSDRDDD